MSTTLRTIAGEAGVSITTVSKIVNGKARQSGISRETQKRVKGLIKKLGYQPNSFARSLRTKKSYEIGIISFDAEDLFAVAVARAAQTVLARNGYHCFVADVKNNSREANRYIHIFGGKPVDGIILLCPSLKIDETTIKEVLGKGILVVSVGRDLSVCGVPSLVVDNALGSFAATEHMISLGHRKLGFIIGSDKYIDSGQRWEGCKSAMKKYGLPIETAIVVKEASVGWDPACGYESMKKILASAGDCTGVIAFDDITAFGAIRAITERGLRVPQDIGVIGFDDLKIAPFCNPPLTTIHQPMKEEGETAAVLLLEGIRSRKIERKRIMFKPKLIIRNSCGTRIR